LIRIGLENGVEGRSLAWGLEHPGLFAYGKTGEEALDNFPTAVQEYKAWIASHDPQYWSDLIDGEFELVETFRCYSLTNSSNLHRMATRLTPGFYMTGSPCFLKRSSAAWDS
jgi:hypothetical protein